MSHVRLGDFYLSESASYDSPNLDRISEREADNPVRDRPHVHDAAGVDGGLGLAGVGRAAGLRVGPAADVGALRQDQGDLQQNQGIHQGRNGKEGRFTSSVYISSEV